MGVSTCPFGFNVGFWVLGIVEKLLFLNWTCQGLVECCTMRYRVELYVWYWIVASPLAVELSD